MDTLSMDTLSMNTLEYGHFKSMDCMSIGDMKSSNLDIKAVHIANTIKEIAVAC